MFVSLDDENELEDDEISIREESFMKGYDWDDEEDEDDY